MHFTGARCIPDHDDYDYDYIKYVHNDEYDNLHPGASTGRGGGALVIRLWRVWQRWQWSH